MFKGAIQKTKQKGNDMFFWIVGIFSIFISLVRFTLGGSTEKFMRWIFWGIFNGFIDFIRDYDYLILPPIYTLLLAKYIGWKNWIVLLMVLVISLIAFIFK